MSQSGGEVYYTTLHVSEHAQDEPLDFFADIEHYQLRKRL